MSDWLNNTNKQYMKALEALYDLGTGDPVPYHLSTDDAVALGYIASTTLGHRAARPDIQSEARFNSIMQRTKAVRDAIDAIKAEMVYSLQPKALRVD